MKSSQNLALALQFRLQLGTAALHSWKSNYLVTQEKNMMKVKEKS